MTRSQIYSQLLGIMKVSLMTIFGENYHDEIFVSSDKILRPCTNYVVYYSKCFSSCR